MYCNRMQRQVKKPTAGTAAIGRLPDLVGFGRKIDVGLSRLASSPHRSSIAPVWQCLDGFRAMRC